MSFEEQFELKRNSRLNKDRRGLLFEGATFNDIGRDEVLTNFLQEHYKKLGQDFNGDAEALKQHLLDSGTRKNSSIVESVGFMSETSDKSRPIENTQLDNLIGRLYESAPDRFTVGKLVTGDWDKGFRDATAASLKGAIVDDWAINLGLAAVSAISAPITGTAAVGTALVKGGRALIAGKTVQQAQKVAARSAITKALGKTAAFDAATEVALGSAGDLAQQSAEQNIGLRDEIDLGQTAMNAARSALLGASIGTVASLPGAIKDGRRIASGELVGDVGGQQVRNVEQAADAIRAMESGQPVAGQVDPVAAMQPAQPTGFTFRVQETDPATGINQMVSKADPKRLSKAVGNIETLIKSVDTIAEEAVKRKASPEEVAKIQDAQAILSQIRDPDGFLTAINEAAQQVDTNGQPVISRGKAESRRAALQDVISEISDFNDPLTDLNVADKWINILSGRKEFLRTTFEELPNTKAVKQEAVSTTPVEVAPTQEVKPTRTAKQVKTTALERQAKVAEEAAAQQAQAQAEAANQAKIQQAQELQAKADGEAAEWQTKFDAKRAEINGKLDELQIDLPVDDLVARISAGEKPGNVFNEFVKGLEPEAQERVKNSRDDILKLFGARSGLPAIKRALDEATAKSAAAKSNVESLSNPAPAEKASATSGRLEEIRNEGSDNIARVEAQAKISYDQLQGRLADTIETDKNGRIKTKTAEQVEAEKAQREPIVLQVQGLAQRKAVIDSALSAIEGNSAFDSSVTLGRVNKALAADNLPEIAFVEGKSKQAIVAEARERFEAARRAQVLQSLAPLLPNKLSIKNLRSILSAVKVDKETAQAIVSDYASAERIRIIQQLNEVPPGKFNEALTELRSIHGAIVDEVLRNERRASARKRQNVPAGTMEMIAERIGKSGIAMSDKEKSSVANAIKRRVSNALSITELSDEEVAQVIEDAFDATMTDVAERLSVTAKKKTSGNLQDIEEITGLGGFNDLYTPFQRTDYVLGFNAQGKPVITRQVTSASGRIVSGGGKWMDRMVMGNVPPELRESIAGALMSKKNTGINQVDGKQAFAAEANEFGFYGRLNFNASRARKEIHDAIISGMGKGVSKKAQGQAGRSEATLEFFRNAGINFRASLDRMASLLAQDPVNQPRVMKVLKSWEDAGYKVDKTAFGKLVNQHRLEYRQLVNNKKAAERVERAIAEAPSDAAAEEAILAAIRDIESKQASVNSRVEQKMAGEEVDVPEVGIVAVGGKKYEIKLDDQKQIKSMDADGEANQAALANEFGQVPEGAQVIKLFEKNAFLVTASPDGNLVVTSAKSLKGQSVSVVTEPENFEQALVGLMNTEASSVLKQNERLLTEADPDMPINSINDEFGSNSGMADEIVKDMIGEESITPVYDSKQNTLAMMESLPSLQDGVQYVFQRQSDGKIFFGSNPQALRATLERFGTDEDAYSIGTMPKMVTGKRGKQIKAESLKDGSLLYFRPLEAGTTMSSDELDRIARAREAVKTRRGKSKEIAVRAQFRPIQREEASKLSITLPDGSLARRVFGGKTEVSLDDVLNELARRDNVAGMPETSPELQGMIAEVIELEQLVAYHAPHGVSRDVQTRTELFSKMKEIFKGDQVQLDSMNRFFTFLQTRTGRMPVIEEGEGWAFDVRSNKIRVSGQDSVYPIAPSMVHETGHWAYQNVLTPEERVVFLNSLERFYDGQGSLNPDSIREALPTISQLEKELGITFTELASRPNEIFAAFFVEHSLDLMNGKSAIDGKVVPEVQGVFAKVIDRVRGFIDRMTARITSRERPDVTIPPEVAEILDRIMPRSARESRFYSDSLLDLETGKVIPRDQVVSSKAKMHLDLVQDLDDIRVELETASRAGVTGNYVDLAENLKKASTKLYLMHKGKRSNMHRIARQSMTEELKSLFGDGEQSKLVDALYQFSSKMDKGAEAATARGEDYTPDVSSADYQSAMEAIEQMLYVGDSSIASDQAVQMLRMSEVVLNAIENVQDKLSERIIVDGYSMRKNRLYEKAVAPTHWKNPPEQMTAAEKWLSRLPNDKDLYPEVDETPAVEGAKSPTYFAEEIKRLKDVISSGTRSGKSKYKIEEELQPEINQLFDDLAVAQIDNYTDDIAPDIEARLDGMSPEEIREELTLMFVEGFQKDGSRVSQAYVQQVLSAAVKNRGAIEPTSQVLNQMIAFESAQRTSTSPLGIPSNLRQDLTAMLEKVTHRNESTQLTAQTVGYRLLNMMGKALDPDGRNKGDVTNKDLATLIGDMSLMEGDGNVSVSQASAAYNSFRKNLRWISEGLGRNDMSAYDRLLDMVINAEGGDKSIKTKVMDYITGKGLDPTEDTRIIELTERLAYLTAGAQGQRPGILAAYGKSVMAKPESPMKGSFSPRSAVRELGEDLKDVELAESVMWLRGDRMRPTVNALGRGISVSKRPDAFFARRTVEEAAENMQPRDKAIANQMLESMEEALDTGNVRVYEKMVDGFSRLFGLDVDERVTPVAADTSNIYDLTKPLDENVATVIMRSMIETKGKTFNPEPMISAVRDGNARAFYEALVRAGNESEATIALENAGYIGVADADNMTIFNLDSVQKIQEIRPEQPAKGERSTFAASSLIINNSPEDGFNEFVLRQKLQEAGAPKSSINVLTKLYKGKASDMSIEDMENLRKASWLTKLLGKNSDRLKENGFNWLGQFAENLYSARDAMTANAIMPIMNMMDRIDPVSEQIKRMDEGFKTFGRLRRSGKFIRQNEKFDKVMKAFRFQDPSILRGDKDALALFNSVDQFFADMLVAQKEAGIPVRDLRNAGMKYYMPQRFDLNLIMSDLNKYGNRMVDYLMEQPENIGRPRDEVQKRIFTLFQTLQNQQEFGGFMPLDTDSGPAKAAGSDLSERIFKISGEDMKRFGLEEMFVNDLRATVVEYGARIQNRLIHTQKFGHKNVGLSAYFATANNGVNGLVEMLTKGKTENHAISGSQQDELYVSDEIFKPLIDGSKEDAGRIARGVANQVVKLLKDGNNGEAARRAAVEYLEKNYRMINQGISNINFRRYAEGLVNGLAENGPSGLKGTNKEYELGTAQTIMAQLYGRNVLTNGKAMSANVSASLRTWNNVTLLGGAVLSSMPDLAGAFIRNGSFTEPMKALFKLASDPDYRSAVRNIGANMEAMLHGEITELHGSTGSRLSNLFFKANGLTPWTKMTRNFAAAAAFETVKAHQQIIKQAALTGKKGRNWEQSMKFLRAAGLPNLTDPLQPSLRTPVDMMRDMQMSIGLHRLTNEAVFAPTRNDMPLWAQTPLGSMVFQFKSFSVMMGRLSMFAAKEAFDFRKEEGKFLPKYQGNPKHLLMMATVGLPLAASSVAVKDIVLSRNEEENGSPFRERSWTKVKHELGWSSEEATGYESDEDVAKGWLFEAALQLGGFGLFADMLVKTAENSDNGAFGTARTMGLIFGPTVSRAYDAVGAASTGVAAAMDVISGKEEPNVTPGEARSAARFVLGAVPTIPFVTNNREVREGIINSIVPLEDGGGQ